MAPYFNHKVFFDALVLMLMRRCSSSFIFMLNLHQTLWKYVPKKSIFYFLHHCRILLQIWGHKGAGTKMHKCILGSLLEPTLIIIWICTSDDQTFNKKMHLNRFLVHNNHFNLCVQIENLQCLLCCQKTDLNNNSYWYILHFRNLKFSIL